MKARTFPGRFIPMALLLAIAGLFASGCRSTPKVDWDSRVGHYTFDQAIAELGPPDKSATLTDGSTVAHWITRRTGGVSFGLGTGYYGGSTGVGVGQTVHTGRGDRVLQLTFGPDKRLVSVSR